MGFNKQNITLQMHDVHLLFTILGRISLPSLHE